MFKKEYVWIQEHIDTLEKIIKALEEKLKDETKNS